MATNELPIARRQGARWTRYLWAGAAAVLSVPFIAMRFTTEVNWTVFDFVVMGALLASACGVIELAVRLSGSSAYRMGALAAVGGGVLVTWANLAVGHEHPPFDLYFFAALGLGVAIASISRFTARGMMAASAITAVALVVVLRLAMLSESDPEGGNLLVTVVSSSAIASPFLLATWLFRKAAAAGLRG